MLYLFFVILIIFGSNYRLSLKASSVLAKPKEVLDIFEMKEREAATAGIFAFIVVFPTIGELYFPNRLFLLIQLCSSF